MAPITLTASKAVIKGEDVHKHRRRFIGPLSAAASYQDELRRPQKQKQKQKRGHRLLGGGIQTDSSNDSDSDDASSISDVVRRHALEFFLKHGGKREDWGESQRKSVRAEMKRRWRETEWGRARKRQRQTGTVQKWVGNSFDIGIFLGVDVLDDALKPPTSLSEDAAVSPSSSVRPTIQIFPPSAEAETFVTAQSHWNVVTSGDEMQNLFPNVSREHLALKTETPDSSTALLVGSNKAQPNYFLEEPPSHPGPSTTPAAEVNVNGILEGSITLDASSLAKGKGKVVHVHYDDTPVPPSEVLARTGDAVKVTSAGAVEQTTSEARTKWGDVIMRGKFTVNSDDSLHRMTLICQSRSHAGPDVLYRRRGIPHIRRMAESDNSAPGERGLGRIHCGMAEESAGAVRRLCKWYLTI